MPRPPERILLFRSGRHLHRAIDALRADSPACDITVVATPSALAALEGAGVDALHRIVYDRTPFFQPWRFIASPAGARALAGRFDRVCVLWNDPAGEGHSNVDRTALLVAPHGFTAITADGTLIPRRTAPVIARETRRAAMSLGVAVLLMASLFLPARALRLFRP